MPRTMGTSSSAGSSLDFSIMNESWCWDSILLCVCLDLYAFFLNWLFIAIIGLGEPYGDGALFG